MLRLQLTMIVHFDSSNHASSNNCAAFGHDATLAACEAFYAFHA